MSVVANVAINVDASKALGQLKSVDQASKGLDSGFKGAAGAAKGLGGAIAAALGPIALVTAAVAGLKAGFDLLGKKQADVANLERGLDGLVANSQEAAKALVGIADELGKQTLFNEEDFTKGFKLLTSFKSIGTDSYERVAIAAADVAEVTGQDVNGSLMQLAKALEDPVKGLNAMARSGTTFTQQQKDQVKALVDSGKKLEAQDLILKELEKQYGGASKAAGSAGFAGAMDTLGEVTRDLQRAVAALLESPLKVFLDLIAQSVGRAAEGYEYLNEVIRTQVLPILQPLIDKIKEVVGEFDITTLIDLWQGGLVIAIRLVVDALRVVIPVAVGILDTLAAIGNNPVFQALIAPLKAVVENLLDARGEITEFQEQSKGSKDALQSVVDVSKELPTEIDEATEKLNGFTKAAEESLAVLREQSSAIDAQIASLDRGASINAARYEAELAINKLKGQQLEREYDLAKTAEARRNIAIQIFNQQAQAAQIEYKQALENIALESKKIELAIEAQKIKYEEIKVEGALQALKSEGGKLDDGKQQKLDEALKTQGDVIRATEDQLGTQREIGDLQKITAAAQLESKILTAQTALESKLVSDKIGMSQEAADRLSTGLKNSAMSSSDLSSSTDRVANNAQRSSFMFIEVAHNAAEAANQITRAAQAQERLNAAQARKGSSGGSSSSTSQMSAPRLQQIEAFAKGGLVTKPTVGLIGEGGESEYVIPASKMGTAAMNYISGGRGAGIMEGGGGGMAAPSINIQTGPVTQMNGQDFVSTADLSSAVQSGVQQTLALLRNDTNTRRAVGIS